MEYKAGVEEDVLTTKAWLLQTFSKKKKSFCFPDNQTAPRCAFHSVIRTPEDRGISVFYLEIKFSGKNKINNEKLFWRKVN